MKRHIIFIALPLMALLIGLISCSSHKQESGEKEVFELSDRMMADLKYESVKKSELRDEMNLYGKVVTDFNKTIEIYPFMGGHVVSVHAELGDFVKKGQLLALVRSVEAAEIEKQLKDAENDVLLAKKNSKTVRELYDGKLASERDLLIANNELDKALSQLKRTQDIYNIYNLKPGSVFEVRSPISGFIIQKNINQDMQLRADRSNNIFDIAQMDDVWVLANVNESEIGKIRLGVDAKIFTLSYSDKVFHGKVDKIFNIVDVETKAMKARIKLQNKGYLLKPEMLATVKLEFSEHGSMINVPSKSVIFDKSKHFVMIYHSRKHIETREVEVFRQVGDLTFIKNGLKEGEHVITEGQLLIYDALND